MDSQSSGRFEVILLFTDISPALSAFRPAAQLAEGLSARIHSVRFLWQLLHAMAGFKSRPVETAADIRLCRDAYQTLHEMLSPEFDVVIRRRSRWWPKPADQLARKLPASGNHVVRTAFRKDAAHA